MLLQVQQAQLAHEEKLFMMMMMQSATSFALNKDSAQLHFFPATLAGNLLGCRWQLSILHLNRPLPTYRVRLTVWRDGHFPGGPTCCLGRRGLFIYLLV